MGGGGAECVPAPKGGGAAERVPAPEQRSGEAAAEVRLRPAVPADLPALARLYSEAFEASPPYRWIFSGDATQPAPEGALHWLFRRRAQMMLGRGCALLVGCGPGGEVVAAGGLVPFDRKPGHIDYLTNGILLWPLWYGLASLRRALSMDGGLARLKGDPLLGGVAGELVLVAVRPDMQGRGLGGRITAALLEQWDASDGRPLLLMTQERHALRLYERHGFKQVEEGDRLGFVNWLMHRPGRQQAGAG